MFNYFIKEEAKENDYSRPSITYGTIFSKKRLFNDNDMKTTISNAYILYLYSGGSRVNLGGWPENKI